MSSAHTSAESHREPAEPVVVTCFPGLAAMAPLLVPLGLGTARGDSSKWPLLVRERLFATSSALGSYTALPADREGGKHCRKKVF